MTRIISIGCIAAVIGLLFSPMSNGDEPDNKSRARARQLQLLEAESNLKMCELTVAASEYAIKEAEVEISKAKASLNSIEMKARSGKNDKDNRIEFARLEVRQAEIRAAMKRLQSEMTKVRLTLAKARLDHLKVFPSQERVVDPIPVKFEIVDDLDAIVIHGSKEGLDRMRSVIERNKEN